jgi:hypothetical protein
MKRDYWTAIGVGFVLFVAMAIFAQDITDPSAELSAQKRFGDIAELGMHKCALPTPQCLPGVNASNWMRDVGYASPKCVNEFTVTGSAFNTWTAAFAASDAANIAAAGPFKATVTINITVYSPTPITAVNGFIDGVQVGSQTPPANTLNTVISFPVDTTTLTNDFHAFCAQANNAQGLGKTFTGALFAVNQTTGTGSATWAPGGVSVPHPQVQFAGFALFNAPSAVLTATYLGATGEDFEGLDQQSPDGIPDWHIHVTGLRSGVTVTRVQVSDSVQAWDWPYDGFTRPEHVQVNGDGSLDSWIPPDGTASDFTIIVTYSDGSTDMTTATVNTKVASLQ